MKTTKEKKWPYLVELVFKPLCFHIWHLLMLPWGFYVLEGNGIVDEHYSGEGAKKMFEL